MVKGHGFLPPPDNPKDYVFGSQELGFKFPYEVLQEDGNWSSYLPKFEHQARQNFETYNCTAYGSLSITETILRRKFNIIEDYSERFIGVIAGTEPPGNDPITVAETIRTQGSILEEDLPFNSSVRSVSDYYSPKPMDGSLKARGLNWLERFTLNYELVWKGKPRNKPELLKAALKQSPIGISVAAWSLDDSDGLYFKNGPDNHWCMLESYENGKWWEIFDSYDSAKKRLKWDTDFEVAIKYYIAKKEPKKYNWFVDLFRRFFL